MVDGVFGKDIFGGKETMKLNLGCGPLKLPGYVNIDVDKKVNPDLVCDLGKEILPFKDNSVDYVYSNHFLEHLDRDETKKLLVELYRVCKGGSKIDFVVPHYLSPVAGQIDHRQSLSECYFTGYVSGVSLDEYFDVKYSVSLQRYKPKNKWFFPFLMIIPCNIFNGEEMNMKLNIGCGLKILPGFVNCDYVPGDGVDNVFDITQGIPYPDDSVDEILVEGVFGHILNWHLKPMSEIHRVLKPGGTVRISEVYGFSHDPFHVRFFFDDTMGLFYNQGRKYGCEDIKYSFELVETFVDYILWGSLTFDRKIIKREWLSTKYFRFLPLVGRKRNVVWVLKKPGEMKP